MSGKDTLIVARAQSCDFEENTLTLAMPDGFWANWKIKNGYVRIVISEDRSEALIMKGTE